MTATQLILRILAGTPLWVWAMLALLVGLGVMQLHDREVPIARAVGVPVGLSLLSLFSAGSFGPAALGAWVPAALLAGLGGLMSARRAMRDTPDTPRDRGPRPGRMQVPGSVLPLVLTLAIFSLRYGLAIALRLDAPFVAHPALAPAVGVAYGACSGLFLGRLLSQWRRHRPAGAVAGALARGRPLGASPAQ